MINSPLNYTGNKFKLLNLYACSNKKQLKISLIKYSLINSKLSGVRL